MNRAQLQLEPSGVRYILSDSGPAEGLGKMAEIGREYSAPVL